MECEFVNDNPKYIEERLLSLMANRIVKELMEGEEQIHEDRSLLPS